jgi:predicted adenine nucleotide alpha hydrolase (AANH) superfamily ATPase
LMAGEEIPFAAVEDYPLEYWLAQVAADADNRCGYCYRSRLEQAAAYAVDHGYQLFSTTLLISPYQNHDLIRETGERIAKQRGLNFVYLDLRGGFRAGQEISRNMGLYMQKYCGCIYSEKERYCSGRGKKHG